MNNRYNVSFLKAFLVFTVATGYFFILLLTLFPWLITSFSVNPALYWFITGYFLFIPLFLYAAIMVRQEGNRSMREIMQALNLKKMSSGDWGYAIVGTVAIFLCTGIIFGISSLLSHYFGLKPLETIPWFMGEMRPFAGTEKLLLLIWLPMFFFNIVGEEILWRGYIQNRMKGKYAWLWCSLLWTFFHIPFGSGVMIMAIPALVIIPYIFEKRKNTLIGIVAHGIYNGPIFILISLGVMN
jgi:membrane protease YdiL (CAAX protease family)